MQVTLLPTDLGALLLSTLAGTQFTPPDPAGTVVKGMSLLIVLTGSISCSVYWNYIPVAAIGGTTEKGSQSLLDTGSRSYIQFSTVLTSRAHTQGFLACPPLTPHTQPENSMAKTSLLSIWHG